MCRQKCRGQSNAEWRPLLLKEGFLPGVRLPKFNIFIQLSLFIRKKQTALQTLLTCFQHLKPKRSDFPCPKPGSDLFCLSRRSQCQVKQSQRHRLLSSLDREAGSTTSLTLTSRHSSSLREFIDYCWDKKSASRGHSLCFNVSQSTLSSFWSP